MEEREYIKLCNDCDFEVWLRTRCINNSFNNIEEGKSFRALVFNPKEEPGDYKVFGIQYKDNLEIFRDTLIHSDDDDFILDDNTMFFIFSYPYQLQNCQLLPFDVRLSLLKILKEDDED